jgi:metal-responsive CopG/Arc/MetJ family transcriptional regulator
VLFIITKIFILLYHTNMRTEKIAITIPSALLSVIDDIRSKRGVSRSKFITLLLREKVMDVQAREIKEAYDTVFSDESIVREQLETATWFEGSGKDEGQEW